jgi:pimeloyl-ACP methyl ester carboxylesterase
LEPLPPPGEMIDIGGRRLHCIRTGEHGATVVFESGGGGGSAIQDLPVQRLVSAFARTLIYDRAGLGWSDPPPPGRSFVERAGDLHALLATIGETPPYILVGGSFGGLAARAFSYRYPDEVAGMVLLDAAEEQKYFPTMALRRAWHEEELRMAAAHVASGEARRAAEPQVARARWFTEDEKPLLLEIVSRPSHFEASLEELSAIDATADEMKVAGGFGHLGDRPLIVLSSGHSPTGDYAIWADGAAEGQQRLAKVSNNSVHIVAPHTGHSMAMENPPLAAAAIAAVINAAAGAPLDVSEVERLAAQPPPRP